MDVRWVGKVAENRIVYNGEPAAATSQVARIGMTALSALLGFMALIVAVGVPAGRFVSVFICIVFALLAVRCARSGLFLSQDGVQVRGLVRTRLFFWEALEGASVERSYSLLPWRIVVLSLREKRDIRVPEVAQLTKRHGPVDYAVELINNTVM